VQVGGYGHAESEREAVGVVREEGFHGCFGGAVEGAGEVGGVGFFEGG
jgi:hypothetical protein